MHRALIDSGKVAGSTPAFPPKLLERNDMTDNTPLLSRIRTMEVGDEITVSVDAYAYGTVRRYATDMSFTLARKFRSHLDRKSRTYTITRLS